MSEQVTITIDGVEHQVKAGINLLEACLSLQLDMPYFCWHPSMGSAGSCRQCAVIQYQNAEDPRGRLVMSCMTPVADGMIVSMNHNRAEGFRATAIEAIMTNHPHDCPVCEEGGDCHLQDMTLISGHINRQYPGTKRTHINQYLGPLLNHEMNRCIGCYRCVRFYRDYAGGDDLNVFASRNRIYFGRAESGTLESHFSGNLAEVCPTGVFTDKPFSGHYARKWDLATTPTICNQCGVGCNTYTSERGGIVRRVNNRLNTKVNGHFLCDRGRFGYEYVNHSERIEQPISRGTSVAEPVVQLSENQAQKKLYQCLDEEEIVVVGSGRSSIENNAALVKLVGRRNFYAAMTDNQMAQLKLLVDWYGSGEHQPLNLEQIEQCDALLIVGEDLSHTAPRLALTIRQMSRNAGIKKAATLGVKQWQDEAVRNIAQDLCSPIHVLNSQASSLDDVCAERQLQTPAQTLAQLHQIEQKLQNSQAQVSGKTEQIVNDLLTAQQPAIITGCHQQSLAMLQACIRITNLLRKVNSNCGFHATTEQANHLALALFCDDRTKIRAMSAFAERLEQRPPATLLIVEADLYRYFDSEQLGKSLDKIKNIVVLDHLLTPTGQMADLICPTTSYAETHGHWLNSEGRLQYSYATMAAIKGRHPAFYWIRHLTELESLAQVQQWTVNCYTALKAMAADIDHHNNPFSLARQPLRSTGRTAINAGIDVKEYPPDQDADSAMNFSMEGVPSFRQQQLNDNPAPVTGMWSPKWNSSQGVNKTLAAQQNQQHQGGYEIFDYNNQKQVEGLSEAENSEAENNEAENSEAETATITIGVNHHIYANQELVEFTQALKQLSAKPTAIINPQLAQRLKLKAGDEIHLQGKQGEMILPCAIAPLAANFVAIPWLNYLQLGEQVSLNSNHHPASTSQGSNGGNHE